MSNELMSAARIAELESRCVRLQEDAEHWSRSLADEVQRKTALQEKVAELEAQLKERGTTPWRPSVGDRVRSKPTAPSHPFSGVVTIVGSSKVGVREDSNQLVFARIEDVEPVEHSTQPADRDRLLDLLERTIEAVDAAAPKAPTRDHRILSLAREMMRADISHGGSDEIVDWASFYTSMLKDAESVIASEDKWIASRKEHPDAGSAR